MEFLEVQNLCKTYGKGVPNVSSERSGATVPR